MSVRPSFEAAAGSSMRPAINGAKWFTTPLDCPHSHPARNCPDMTSALKELIAGVSDPQHPLIEHPDVGSRRPDNVTALALVVFGDLDLQNSLASGVGRNRTA
ncbi:MAG: hypothetical protein ABWY20_00610 [Mycobacterium sp.]